MIDLLVKIAFGLAAAFLAVYYSVKYIYNRHSELEQDVTPEKDYTTVELENARLAEELYNKDLRPIVAKKAPKKTAEVEEVKPEVVKEVKQTKSEFPIDKPKKKRRYYPKKK
jgi:hypothetical protein